jgi:hypothetical protein
MSFTKKIKDLGHLLIEEAQEILRFNGAYRSGRLYDNFKLSVSETPEGIVISITNDTAYAGFIDKGTHQWKDSKQQQNPVIRKYSAIPSGAYPFNKKGIEPINFMDPLNERLIKLNGEMTGIFSKKIAEDIVSEFKTKVIS